MVRLRLGVKLKSEALQDFALDAIIRDLQVMLHYPTAGVTVGLRIE